MLNLLVVKCEGLAAPVVSHYPAATRVHVQASLDFGRAPLPVIGLNCRAPKVGAKT